MIVPLDTMLKLCPGLFYSTSRLYAEHAYGISSAIDNNLDKLMLVCVSHGPPCPDNQEKPDIAFVTCWHRLRLCDEYPVGAMEKSARPASQQGGEYRNRLPTFEEVLSRKTRPPVDLFMFYLFLQREGAEDVLDFWLDVQQHENLCRAYFKDVRKSGRTIREDWPQYWEYARRRGSIYGHVVGLGNTSSPSSPNTTFGAGTGKRSTFNSAPDIDVEKRGRTPSPGPPLSGRPITPGGTGADGYRVARAPSATDDRDPRSTTPFEKARRTSGLFKRASRAPT
ncbi:Bud site selection protein, Revert to axial protein 1, partial [Ceratobasidium sp. 395]